MRGRLALLGGVLGVTIMAFTAATNTLSTEARTTITDVSWPNCAKLGNLGSTTGIVGVNGGLDFRPNRCLNNESKVFAIYALYLNTGYPGPAYAKKFSRSPLSCSATNSLCLAYNYGYHAAQYSITYANMQSAHAFMWWLDVETSNSWTTNALQNRAALSGMVAALQQYTFLPTIGFYSYPGQWNLITGNWKNGFPVWAATGTASHTIAKSFCQNENFTSGTTWLTQYTTNLDHNYLCSNDFLQHIGI